MAALFPHAGGQYIYLREAYSPLWGFLYGWTLFLVIQTGTIAAVAVGFARYLGVLFPAISGNTWIVPPIALGSKYAISLSVQQLVGVLMIVFLTFLNMQGVRLGKLIQNVFTSAKTLSLLGLIFLCVFVGAKRRGNLGQFRPYVGGTRRATHRTRRQFSALDDSDGDRSERSLRLVCRVRRGAGRFAVLRRRLEQHRVSPPPR